MSRLASATALAAVTVLSLASPALAARIDAGRVFRATVGFLEPDKFKEVRAVHAAPDGSVWIVGVDWGFGDTRGPSWFARRLSSAGVRLGRDIPLFPGSGLGLLDAVVPAGTLPDGSLVVEVLEKDPESRGRLAKIGPGGTTEMTGVLPRHDPYEPFVDRVGTVHLVTVPPNNVNYMEVNMAAAGLPIVRSLVYDQPFNGLPSVPDYLRWGGRMTYFSELGGRLLAARRRLPDDTSCIRLCRVDSKTLALIDTGRIDLTRDVYRTWSGPTIRKRVIVPAGKSGYWIFSPTTDTPPAPTIVAYRIRPDLSVVRPAAVTTGVAGPFAAAPAGAVVSIQTKFERRGNRERWIDGVRIVPAKLTLKFIALGSDGRLYTQAFEDSITSRVSQ